jgi:hypothetical protein
MPAVSRVHHTVPPDFIWYNTIYDSRFTINKKETKFKGRKRLVKYTGMNGLV